MNSKVDLLEPNEPGSETEHDHDQGEDLSTISRLLHHIEGLEKQIAQGQQDVEERGRLQQELKAFKEEASRCSREDDREIRKLKRDNSEAESTITRLSSEIDELRKVIEEYVERINGMQESMAADDSSALRTELRLVREQAEKDLAKMRKQLKDHELSGSAETAENDVLRREIADFKREQGKQQQALDDSLARQRQLAEEIEFGKSEIERLERVLEIAREELEESNFQRRDEQEARGQLEEALHDLQQKVGGGASTPGDHRPTEHPGHVQAPKKAAAAGRYVGRTGTRGLLLGALLAFALVEGISMMRGRGEIITGLLERERPPLSGLSPASTTVRQANGGQPMVDPDQAKQPIISRQAVIADSKSESAGSDTGSSAPASGKTTQSQGQEPATGTIIQDRLRRGGRGPLMIYVRGEEFTMGRQRDQLDRDEGPVHQVRLNRYAIGRDEVTFDEYMIFAAATGRRIPDDQGWGRGQQPVINVSWEEATAYTKWLSGQTGRRYRLPTEAEWEYAASGGGDGFYWWGYRIGEGNAACFDCGSRWDGVSTAPVGSFAPNPFGINDTAGNVVEWVEDCYHASYQGAPADGAAWIEPGCYQRVARGGAYNKPSDSLRTSKRFYYEPGTRLPILGFRVVRELE